MVLRYGVMACVVALIAACGWGDRSISVIGPNGKAIVGADVIAVRPGEEECDAWVETEGRHGTAEIPASAVHANSRLVIIAPGCRLVDREMPTGDLEVRLAKGIPVHLILDDNLEPLSDSLTLVASFRSVVSPAGLSERDHRSLPDAATMEDYHEREEWEREAGDCRFGKSGRSVTVLLPYPGRWKVRLSAMRFRVRVSGNTVDEWGSGRGMKAATVPEITVEDRTGVQTFVLTPDREEYRRIVKEMRSED